MTIKIKNPVDEDIFRAKLTEAIGKRVLQDKKSALANTIFDPKDDPASLDDACAQCVIAERLNQSKIVYFFHFRRVEAYVFGENLVVEAESAFDSLNFALKGSDATISSVESNVRARGADMPILQGTRSTKLSRAKKTLREGLVGKVVPAASTYLIASQIPTITNVQSIILSILTAVLTLVADTLVAMYRDNEWTWTGRPK